MQYWWTRSKLLTSASDGELLERHANQGDARAFAIVMRRHQVRVLRVCQRILGDEHVAEDVCQETFLVLAKRAGAVPWQASVAPWLTSVARRLALQARSRRRTHEPLGSGEGELVSIEADPHAQAAHSELRGVIGAELARLPDKYREPVQLCYLEGRSNVEAARLLGWPTGSMSRRLGRARALLLERLGARGLAMFAFIGMLCGGWWSFQPSAEPDLGTHEPIANLCGKPAGRDALIVLETLMRGDSPELSRAELAELAGRIAAGTPDRPGFAELQEAADALAEEAVEPARPLLEPAGRVLALCASCHASAR